MESDHHHILNTRSDWESNKHAKKLRRHSELIPELEVATHIELHKNCPSVPLLGHLALCQILQEFEPASTTFQTVDRLKQSIERTTYKAHWIERELGQLAIYSLDIQMPYILDGEIKNRW